MVGKQDLPNAIALNSSIFNGARVVGPAIAGFAIKLSAKDGAFREWPELPGRDCSVAGNARCAARGKLPKVGPRGRGFCTASGLP